MTKPEDDLPRFYIEAAQAVVQMHPSPSEEATGKAIEAVRRAILSAVEEEREACACLADNWEGPALLLPMGSEQQNIGASVGMHEAAERIADAIRSRKEA